MVCQGADVSQHFSSPAIQTRTAASTSICIFIQFGYGGSRRSSPGVVHSLIGGLTLMAMTKSVVQSLIKHDLINKLLGNMIEIPNY